MRKTERQREKEIEKRGRYQRTFIRSVLYEKQERSWKGEEEVGFVFLLCSFFTRITSFLPRGTKVGLRKGYKGIATVGCRSRRNQIEACAFCFWTMLLIFGRQSIVVVVSNRTEGDPRALGKECRMHTNNPL